MDFRWCATELGVYYWVLGPMDMRDEVQVWTQLGDLGFRDVEKELSDGDHVSTD